MRTRALLAVSLLAPLAACLVCGADWWSYRAGLRSSARSFGVTLTMRLQRSTYPRNALLPVRLEVYNGSRTPITLPGPAGACPYALTAMRPVPGNPQDLVNVSVAFPRCDTIVVPGGRTLAPGHSLAESIWTIAAAPFLSASLPVGSCCQEDVTTLPLSLHLLPPDPPSLRFTSGPAPRVAVLSPAPDPGPLYAVNAEGCDGGEQATTLSWHPEPSTGFRAPPLCHPLRAWALMVAYPGHSIALATYPPARAPQIPLTTDPSASEQPAALFKLAFDALVPPGSLATCFLPAHQCYP